MVGGHRLVVSATQVEAAHVPPGTDLLVTGIGKVAAASAVAARLAGSPGRYSEVVDIGSAGALRDGLSGLYVPSRVLNHDISAAALERMGYATEDTLALEGGDGTVLATGDLFVADPAVRSRLALRVHLVDMEGFAVAWACRRAGVACRLVKHVSDDADTSSMQWPELVERSAVALGEWLAAN